MGVQSDEEPFLALSVRLYDAEPIARINDPAIAGYLQLKTAAANAALASTARVAARLKLLT